MEKLTPEQKKQVRHAQKQMQAAADILQEIQEECDGENAATLEEIGVALGFGINEIEEKLLN